MPTTQYYFQINKPKTESSSFITMCIYEENFPFLWEKKKITNSNDINKIFNLWVQQQKSKDSQTILIEKLLICFEQMYNLETAINHDFSKIQDKKILERKIYENIHQQRIMTSLFISILNQIKIDIVKEVDNMDISYNTLLKYDFLDFIEKIKSPSENIGNYFQY